MKIYDRVSFPFILNMNDYIKGYEGIQNKLYEKEVARLRQYCQAQIDKNRTEEEKHAAKRVKTDHATNNETEQMMAEDTRMQEAP